MRLLFILLTTLFLSVVQTNAQDRSPFKIPPLEPITVKTAPQITEIARLGKGITTSTKNILLSPDSNTLAIGTSLGVWLYDVFNWKNPPKFLELGEGDVSKIAFSPDSQSIAVLNYPFWYGIGQSFTVWDVKNGQKKFDLKTHTVNGNILYSPDGKLLAAGDIGDVQLFNAEDGSLLATIQATSAVVDTVAFSPDGRLLAATSNDSNGPGTMINEHENVIRIWDVDTALNKIELTIEDAVLKNETEDFPHQIQFSPDGQSLAFNFSKCCTSIWNLTDNTTKTFDNTTDDFGLRDNQLLFQQEQQIVQYDPQIHKSKSVMRLEKQAQFGMTDDEASAYWITDGDTLHLWEAKKTQDVVLDKASGIEHFVLRRKLLVALQADGIRIWNAETGLLETYLEGFIPDARSIHFTLSPDGKLLAYSLNGGKIYLLDLEDGQIAATFNGDLALSFSPDAQYLTFQRDNNTILWDLGQKSEAKVFPIKGHLVFSSDSSVFAFVTDYVYSSPTLVEIYTTSSLTNIFSIPDGASDLIFNADGSRLTTIGDKIVTLWNVENGTIITRLNDNSLPFNHGLGFSPTGRPVAALAQNTFTPDDERFSHFYHVPTSIEVYDIRTGQRRHYFEFQPINQNLGGNIYPRVEDWTIQFSPQGNWLTFIATGEMEEKGVFLWDLQQNEMHTVVNYNMNSYSHPTFSPDGKLLIVTGGNYLVMGGANLDSSVYIYDVVTRKQLATLANHTEAPSQVEMSQDKRLIVSASYDGTIRLWGVPKS